MAKKKYFRGEERKRKRELQRIKEEGEREKWRIEKEREKKIIGIKKDGERRRHKRRNRGKKE